MNKRNTILEELEALNSGLPADQGPAPFSVPEGYFDGLAAAVLARIKTGAEDAAQEIDRLSPLLAGLPKHMPLTVPDRYFSDNLESLAAVVGEEPVPASFPASRQMPYEVPAGYFSGLSGQVWNQVEKPSAKIIPLHGRKWMRWAAAAMIAGVVTLSGIFYFTGKKDIPVDSPQWMAAKLQNVSDKDIEDFVKSTDISATAAITAKNTPVEVKDVQQMLQDVSDTELDNFLDQVPADETAIN